MNINLRNPLICTLSAIGVAGASSAAVSQTAPAITAAPNGFVSNILDGAAPGTLTVAGITVYGTFDVGTYYSTHGNRAAPGIYTGTNYFILQQASRSRFDYTDNGLGVSKIGVSGTQALDQITGLDSLHSWSVGFTLETGFDPVYGANADFIKSLTQNNGSPAIPSSNQRASGDGSRAGQFFNGEAFASLKNTAGLGELRFGRNNTLLFTSIGSYDPNGQSQAYSLVGFSGTYGGGGGDTEDTRWNNSIKYTNTIGILRVGAAYRFEGGGQGGDAYSLMAGVDAPGALKGLSIDGVWAHTNDAIAVAALSSAQCGDLGLSIASCQSTNYVAGTISDNDAYALMAKYKFSQATIMGGYEHIAYNNPSSKLSTQNIIGGYIMITDPVAKNSINYSKYLSQKDIDLFFVGGRYQFTPKLTGSAGWYHYDQGSFTSGNAVGAPTPCSGLGTNSNVVKSNCRGSFDMVSGYMDYQATKRLDFYAGVAWSEVHDGLSSGFTYKSLLVPSAGMRFKF